MACCTGERLLVDADACPVKAEVYRVAGRYGLEVTLVANARMRIPAEPWIRLEVVGSASDAADDWIAEQVRAGDIVVTTDIPLASRCLKAGAAVVSPTGKRFTEANIGSAVATRDLLTELRSAGELTGGPPRLEERDRSRFLQELDTVVQAGRRQRRSAAAAVPPPDAGSAG
jgi:uncharacterized protein YaiI (UPF0178 family)